MSCNAHQQAIAAFSPDGADLPDETALHLDGCEACRAAFDARFVPADVPRVASDDVLREDVPGGLRERVLDPLRPPKASRWRWAGLGGVVTLAAALCAGVVLVGGGASLTMVASERGPSPVTEVATAYRPHVVGDTGAPRGRDGVADPTPGSAKPKPSPDDHDLRTIDVEHGRFDGDLRTEPPLDEPAVANDVVKTSDDPLSTFSVDVDTASYTATRGRLLENWLPVPAEVRPEEFVNYFHYEYRRPTDAPFAVDAEAAPSPWHAGKTIVRVGLQGRVVAADARPPVHLTFLVDTSGSMEGENKIGLVKKTLTMLTNELGDEDTVAIVTYAGSAGVVLAPTPMSRKIDVFAALDELSAGGSTAMGEGIVAAYALAEQTYARGAINRVVLCTDGDANVGPTSPEALTELVRDHAKRGITLTTAGFGRDIDDRVLERLADDGDGNYFFVDSEDEARRVFVDKLVSTVDVIAKNVKVQVVWDPKSVADYRLVGYADRDVADRDFRNDDVDAGEVGAGHQVTALYEVDLVRGAKGPLGKVSLRYEAPGPDSPAVETSYDVGRDVLRPSFAETSADFRVAVAAGTFAEKLGRSPYAEDVSYARIGDVARKAARAEYPEEAQLVDLIANAARLAGDEVAPAAKTGPVTVRIGRDDPFSGFDVTRCGDLPQAYFRGGVATLQDVPVDGECTLVLAGGPPTAIGPVHGGQTWTCRLDGATARCEQ